MPGIRKALDVANGGVAFHFCDASEPIGAILLFDVRKKSLKNFASVADESGVNLNVLVDFGAIDFDMNLAGALGVGAQIAGDAIIETHSDGDQEIGFLNGVIDPGF